VQRKYPTGLYVEKENELQIYQGLRKGECDIALNDMDSYKSFKNKIEYNPNCDIERVGEEVTHMKASFAIKASGKLCSYLLRNVIDLHLLEMKMNYTLDRIIKTAQKVTCV